MTYKEAYDIFKKKYEGLISKGCVERENDFVFVPVNKKEVDDPHYIPEIACLIDKKSGEIKEIPPYDLFRGAINNIDLSELNK